MTLIFTIASLINDNSLPGHGGTNATTDTIKTVLQIIFVTIGALAVLLIVIAGLRYITAAGEPAKVAQAKSAILYALIGLVIAASAELIVGFVVGRL
jgi:hypothetical protein